MLHTFSQTLFCTISCRSPHAGIPRILPQSCSVRDVSNLNLLYLEGRGILSALAYNRTGGTRPLCLPLKPDERCGDAVYARISESGLPRPVPHTSRLFTRQLWAGASGTWTWRAPAWPAKRCSSIVTYTALRDARVIWQEWTCRHSVHY